MDTAKIIPIKIKLNIPNSLYSFSFIFSIAKNITKKK